MFASILTVALAVLSCQGPAPGVRQRVGPMLRRSAMAKEKKRL
jgi:hypothetical protein